MEYVLFPRSEIQSRIKKLQSQMGEMDGALLFHSVDMCYFSGTAQDGLVYVPRDGEPVVMIRRSLERAAQESPLEVRPLSNMRSLKSDLAIPDRAVIGLEMDVLPCSFYFKVDNALDGARFVDVAEKIKHIRSVKSDFELGLMKESARILEAGFSSVPDFLEEGMKEVDLISRLEMVISFPALQQHRPPGPCHVRARRSQPQLSGLAHRGQRNLPDLSPGGRLFQDKKK
ncbi:MAG: aminopeptidase P family N-terminal domain-containing protein [Methanothrix sp.]|nr:aminopeptidase P family N-terminal domain-containing protein [Methanothrix sp.]OYV08823.1 MAG: Xaa-Pro dipeptidase [Methanosaeta sp. NSP1]